MENIVFLATKSLLHQKWGELVVLEEYYDDTIKVN
jgi:hypothetical protein